MTKIDPYLQKILTAKVYDVAVETPLDKAPNLSARLSNTILIKREDLQKTFSFKVRGAYNKIAHLSEEELKKGVICASAGNHAQGVALAAKKLGIRAVIVMPTTSPSVKVNAVKAKKAEVVLHGESYSDAFTHAKIIEKKEGLTFIHPFDDPYVIAGQGTIAVEILRQYQGPLDAVFVAVGGGGLISGIATYIKHIRPEVKVIAVEPADSDAMHQSIKQNKRVILKNVGLFADGVAVKQVGKENFKICKKFVDDFVLVSTDEIAAGIKDCFEDLRAILEPSGAVAVAGVKKYIDQKNWKGKNVVAIACGANMNFDRLRFVAERAEVGEKKEALFAVTLPERPGALKEFCNILGDRSVTEFNYRYSDKNIAHIFLGVTIKGVEDLAKFKKILSKSLFPFQDLTESELAKLHIRHMIGGHISNNNPVEQIFRIEFPEKPGALTNFLSHLPQALNISLFHYRNHGSDMGRVLIGLQVERSKNNSVLNFLNTVGYSYCDETKNLAYNLFLG